MPKGTSRPQLTVQDEQAGRLRGTSPTTPKTRSRTRCSVLSGPSNFSSLYEIAMFCSQIPPGSGYSLILTPAFRQTDTYVTV